MAGRRKKSTPKIVPKVEEMDASARIVEEQLHEGNIGGEVLISIEGESGFQQRHEDEDSYFPEVIIKIEHPLSDSDQSLSSSPHIVVADVPSICDAENDSNVTRNLPSDEPPSRTSKSISSSSSIQEGVGNRTRSKNPAQHDGMTLRNSKRVESHNGVNLRNSKPVESSKETTCVPKKTKVKKKPPKLVVAKKPHACDKCELSFAHKIELIHHGSAHADDKRFGCDQCGYRARRIDYLLTHMRTHTGERPFPCVYCPYSARDSSELRAHELIHTDVEYESDLKAFSCTYCNYKTLKRRYLDTHLTKHTGERPFACTICPYTARTKNTLEQHMKGHTGEKMHACEKCDYKSITRNNLRHHVLKYHTEISPYACDECDYKCISATRLKDHQRAHRGEKPYYCDICEFSSTVAGTLKTHMRIHTGEKPHPCSQCGYRAARYSALRIHMKSRHSVKDERNLSCDLCNYRTKSPSELKLHKMIHAGTKPFGCALCDYRTNKKNKLIPHLRRHYGWRPFKCTMCNWRFIEKSELRIHMRVHYLRKTKDPNMSGVQHVRSFGDLQTHKAKMTKAVQAIQERKLPIKKAARVYGVPVSTLYYRIYPRRQYGKKSTKIPENGMKQEDHSTEPPPSLKLNPFAIIPSKGKAQTGSACMDVDADGRNNGVNTSLSTFVGEREIMAAAARLPEARVVLQNVVKEEPRDLQPDPEPALHSTSRLPNTVSIVKEEPRNLQPDPKPTLRPTSRLPNAVSIVKEEPRNLQPDPKPTLRPTSRLPNAVSNGWPYVCKTCRFEAFTGFALQEHRKFHLGLLCGLCDFRSQNIDDLKRHVMSVHIM